MLTTPGALRLQIGIFGKRNAGKSSLLNALANQECAIVSDTPGTTTDPVFKAMEIPVLGPVLLMDTAGLDDDDERLGEQRREKSLSVLDRADLMILLIDHSCSVLERTLLEEARKRNTPLIAVFNKSDLYSPDPEALNFLRENNIDSVSVSAREKTGLDDLLGLILKHTPDDFRSNALLLEGVIRKGDLVLMVTPTDSAAPRGRLILPQVQAIRDALDHDAYTLVVKENAVGEALAKLKTKPDLIVTDSQAFAVVSKAAAPDIPLTSFSILMARLKGDLALCAAGARAIASLKKDALILIAEACTHPAGHEDIGTVKIPALLKKLVGPSLQIRHVHGHDFPKDLSGVDLVIHCGGCMLNSKEMLSRILQCRHQGVPFTNYGIFLAYGTGILRRALSPFPEALRALEETTGEVRS